ncbi:MAG: hypothetical protein ABI867_09430 [Kofleriaceae bacterium]
MWARVHKIDRIRPQPNGGAIVLVEDERTTASMARVPGLSTIVAISRILNARRVLAAKYAGKGEIRYAALASPPPFLAEAISRAGAHLADGNGERIVVPATPGSVASVVDAAFAELAYYAKSNIGNAVDMANALRATETMRRKSPLDRDTHPAQYWTAVLELAALAGELSRARGGRWVETTEMPVPFAIQFPESKHANPVKLAMRIVDGGEEESLATDAAVVDLGDPPAS